jgi:hypothetical protein
MRRARYARAACRASCARAALVRGYRMAGAPVPGVVRTRGTTAGDRDGSSTKPQWTRTTAVGARRWDHLPRCQTSTGRRVRVSSHRPAASATPQADHPCQQETGSLRQGAHDARHGLAVTGLRTSDTRSAPAAFRGNHNAAAHARSRAPREERAPVRDHLRVPERHPAPARLRARWGLRGQRHVPAHGRGDRHRRERVRADREGGAARHAAHVDELAGGVYARGAQEDGAEGGRG